MPAVGLGALGRSDDSIWEVASRFVRRAGADEPVLLAMATGRVVSRDLGIPILNVSPRFIITSTQWWITDRKGQSPYAHGALKDIIGVFTTSDGVAVYMSEDQTARFLVGRGHASHAKALIGGILAHAQLATSRFDDIAPSQRPLVLAGTHVGGHGTELEPGDECVVAVSGRGICASGAGSVFLEAADSLRTVQIGGLGNYTTGGGWVGGGLGARGALEGAAFAGLMNSLTTRRHIDCLVRFVFDNAEATFSLASDTPQRLQLDASALLAAIRDPSVAPSAGALQLATVAQREGSRAIQSDSAAEDADAFCGFCGNRRVEVHKFCAKCGNPYDA